MPLDSFHSLETFDLHFLNSCYLNKNWSKTMSEVEFSSTSRMVGGIGVEPMASWM